MSDTDNDMRTFIESQPRHASFSDIATACREKFGDVAWSRSEIINYWQKAHPIQKGRTARIDLDNEVRVFIEDRAGRMTLDELVAVCREAFGPNRSPSRSGVHRFLNKGKKREWLGGGVRKLR